MAIASSLDTSRILRFLFHQGQTLQSLESKVRVEDCKTPMQHLHGDFSAVRLSASCCSFVQRSSNGDKSLSYSSDKANHIVRHHDF